MNEERLCQRLLQVAQDALNRGYMPALNNLSVRIVVEAGWTLASAELGKQEGKNAFSEKISAPTEQSVGIKELC